MRRWLHYKHVTFTNQRMADGTVHGFKSKNMVEYVAILTIADDWKQICVENEHSNADDPMMSLFQPTL